MKKLILSFLLLFMVVACNPKVDPIEQPQPEITKHVVVKLWWTSHCEYCVKQVLVFQEIQTEIELSWIGENVEIRAINPFDTAGEIVGFLQKNDVSLPIESYPMPPASGGLPLTIIYVRGQDEPVTTLLGLQSKEVILDAIQQTLDMLVIRGRIPPR